MVFQTPVLYWINLSLRPFSFLICSNKRDVCDAYFAMSSISSTNSQIMPVLVQTPGEKFMKRSPQELF